MRGKKYKTTSSLSFITELSFFFIDSSNLPLSLASLDCFYWQWYALESVRLRFFCLFIFFHLSPMR